LRRHAAARSSATAAETAAWPAAKAVASTSEAVTAATEPVTAAEAVLITREWIETVLSETVPLVASPSATPSVKTHFPERTFASPRTLSPSRADEARKTSQ